MLYTIGSPIGFIIVFALFAFGAVGSLLAGKKDALANGITGFFSIAGSFCGMLFAGSALFTNANIAFTLPQQLFPLVSFSFYIDKLSVFFIFAISLIAFFCSIYGIGYMKHFYKKYSLGAFGFFYNLFLLSMLLVVSVSHGAFFLIVWEIMSLASYFLVVYDRKDEENVKAGFVYLVMTHIGTAFIIASLLLLYKFTGSFDFMTIQSSVGLIPLWAKNAVFILALVGFGTKVGIIPFHIWLPKAHPAAPSHVSGLMSGVMIKTGIFMMIRIFLDMLQPVPLWWGLVILVVGFVSALLGVLYALAEHDLKRLLAYSSIENIGIILLGLGSALVFSSLGMGSLALLGLVAALFHTLNHALFKALLFLSAGSVINQTHTRNMEEYGGLIKRMPQTAGFFLIGSMAISALPPLNGFFSEWLTFQSLFQGIIQLGTTGKTVFILASGALALTGGLASACFVKAFASVFLARPRSHEAEHAEESKFPLLTGMSGLALLCILCGIFSASLTSFFETIGKNLSVFRNANSFLSISPVQSIEAGDNFASVSAVALVFIFFLSLLLVIIFFKYIVRDRQKTRTGATWDCGTDLTPRMEITATGFARSITLIFERVLKPSIQREVEYHDAETRYLPKSVTISSNVQNVYEHYFYKPLHSRINTAALRITKIQSGNANAYILYIFIALIVLLFFV